MVFSIYPNGRVFISGSLHKLYNFILGRAINHDVFTYRKVSYTINFLKEQFNLNPSKSHISNLEFGVNIQPNQDVNKIINSFIVFKMHPFSKMKTRAAGYGKDCYLSEYGIKVYNKGLQYNCKENILRFEKKVYKMRSEFNNPIVLNDLLDKKKWYDCANSLLIALDEIIIFDKIKTSELSKPDLSLLNECINPLAWKDFTRRQRHQKKERFNKIMEANSQIQTKKHLVNLIQGALNHMLSYSTYHNSSLGTTIGCYLPNWKTKFIEENIEKQVTFPPTVKNRIGNIPTLQLVCGNVTM